ncbi:MAG: DUF2252 family protein, partial [Deltaproteobacteria bacterium]
LFAADWVAGLCAPWRDGKERERDPIVGDVHLESFGAHEVETSDGGGAVLFSIQDFDEAAEGDFDLDVFRAAASAALAVDQAGLPLATACTAAARLAQGYADQAQRLARGDDPPDWIVSEAEHAPGPIAELCRGLAAVSRERFIDGLCERSPGRPPRLRRSERHQDLRPERARAVLEAVGAFLRQRRARAPMGQPLLPVDVVYRVAGTGGLGRFRYAVLLSPESAEPGAEILIELKESSPAALDLHRNRTQADQAERVVRRALEAQG